MLFFIFCFIWREFTLLTDDGSAIYVHSREPIRQRHQKPWGQFYLYTQNIYIAEPGFFDQALQTDVDKEFIKMIDKYNQGFDAKFALLTYKLSYVVFCQASYRSLNNASILLQQRHMMKLTIRKLKGYGCSVYWKCCKRSKMPIFFETLTINFYYRTGTV